MGEAAGMSEKGTDLSEKRLFLFDIDGTIALGSALIDGTHELLREIQRVGGKYIFITNNSTKSVADYVQKFNAWQIPTDETSFVTASTVTLRWLTQYFTGKKIFAVATKSFVRELQNHGLWVTVHPEEDVSCLLVGYDSELTYKKLWDACYLFQKNPALPFAATNPDLCCPTEFGFVPDCGSICETITNATGKTPSYLGKPSRVIVDVCLQSTGFSPEQTLVVGDRLYTDIACGINAGVDTALVLTGEAKREDLSGTAYPPTITFDSVKELYQAFADANAE